MRNQFQLYLIFAASWTSTNSFQWTSEPADNGVQHVCQGDDLHLLWDFNTTGNSIVTSIQWFFKGSSEDTVAIKTHEHFLPQATYYDRVRFVPGAGLVISHVVLADKGNYSVEVLGSGNSFVNGKQSRSVTVEFAEPPKSDNDDLLVREDDTAWFDNSTGQWAVRLTCGHLVHLGQPPVDVVWTTPSGQTVNSSSQENGDFHLLLYSPVQGGNYVCSLRPQSPAASCLSNTSGLAQTFPYHVSQVHAQLKVMQSNEITQLNQLQELRESQENTNKFITQLRQKWQEKEENTNKYIAQLEGELAICQLPAKPTSCVDSNPVSGVVTIYPDNVTAVEVYCDQDTDGGGWAVFQRRQDGSVDFYRNWTDYQNQFGDLNGEFWIGLDALHTLTSSQPQELRVDLTKWDLTRVSASYSGFTISDGDDYYRLNFTSFLGGTAGDSLAWHRGHQFSTKDADHDTIGSEHCAQRYLGAWWYYSCYYSNLNGEYKNSSSAPRHDGLIWNTAGYTYSMKATEMKLRPS